MIQSMCFATHITYPDQQSLRKGMYCVTVGSWLGALSFSQRSNVNLPWWLGEIQNDTQHGSSSYYNGTIFLWHFLTGGLVCAYRFHDKGPCMDPYYWNMTMLKSLPLTMIFRPGILLASSITTVYPKKYAHGFVVLCFVVVMQSFIMISHEVFIHIHHGCFAGTGAIVRLPQCQWSKPDGYGKISQCITTTKHSKAKTVCIFLGIYCTSQS